MNFSVFILAAGRGKRLRPITDYIPKPLVPILGTPVLQTVLEKMSALPANKIGINLHYKNNLIKNWLDRSSFSNQIVLFPEDPVLGTGGALKNATTFLKDSLFLVHNSDIISDIDLRRLVDFQLSSENLATLAVHDYPEFNKLGIDRGGFLKSISALSGAPNNLAFTGIAVYSPQFLDFLPGGVSSVTDAWLKAIESGSKIGTFNVTGCYWNDIGTPSAYTKAVIRELRNNGETVYIHPSVKGCSHIELDGYTVIEKDNEVDADISIRNCILLPKSKIKPGSIYDNCILGTGFKIDLGETDFFNTTENNALLIGTGGSDRKYCRIRKDAHSTVLMQCAHDDPDFRRHVEYTRFFQKHSVPVPELLEVDFKNCNALFEDLGDLSLYSLLKCSRDLKCIEEIYKKAIDIAILIHTTVTEHISECPLFQGRVFDYDHLRWETSYFIERFVQGISDIRFENLSTLNEEFHRLAVKVDAFPKTIIHRDFQSQNIMVTKRNTPRLIDYQGARIGPPAYDIASILWDPYYRLDDDVRENLLFYYINGMSENTQWFNENEFRKTTLPCRLQRHMQALGAYGFLSGVKGKKYFLKYVPEGIRLLKEDLVLAKDEYPVLNGLVKTL